MRTGGQSPKVANAWAQTSKLPKRVEALQNTGEANTPILEEHSPGIFRIARPKAADSRGFQIGEFQGWGYHRGFFFFFFSASGGFRAPLFLTKGHEATMERRVLAGLW